MLITFIPLDGHGHVNSCLGLAQSLRKLGHNCSFILAENWRPIVESQGFKVSTITIAGFESFRDPQERLNQFMSERSSAFTLGPIEQFRAIRVPRIQTCFEFIKQSDEQYAELIKIIKPDLIIYVSWLTVPAIVNSGCPYILFYTCNPLLIYWELNAPPYSSGLGAKDDVNVFGQLRSSFEKSLDGLRSRFDDFLISKGINLSTEKKIDFTLIGKSPYLNLYCYPNELDYIEFGVTPSNWFRLDHVVRETDSTPLGVDEKIFKMNRKIILFAFGSQASSSELMKRILTFLAKSEHFFIISLGTLYGSIQLASNMVGSKYLNQIELLPKVDLVIHHGGNNTFIECLYFCKPMIVMPLFGDQHDNGRRVVDMKIGETFYPHEVTETKLLETIDKLLCDLKLQDRIKLISDNLKSSQSHQFLNDKLEKIVQNHNKFLVSDQIN